MSRPRTRQRIGLLAIAFDASGRGILDALVARPDLAETQVHCYHMAATEEGSPPAWYHRTGRQGWEAANGAGHSDPGQTLESAVRTALDRDRWLTADGGIDLLDIVLLNPVSDLRPTPLPDGVLEALRRIRRKFYQRIARIFLLVDGSFETFGESATRGLIRPLPFGDGSDQRVFDLVILLDRLNLAGMVMNDGAEAMRYAAGVLSLLTTSEMAVPLYQRIQAEQARTGDQGRYVAVGLTEWRLEERGIEATSDLLYRRMAAALTSGPALPAAAQLPADPWIDKVSAEVLQTSDQVIDPISLAAGLEAEGREVLRSLVRAAGWAVPMLAGLLDRRVGELARVAAQAHTRLALFMISRFAPWYVRHKTGGSGTDGGQPAVITTKRPRHDRMILCAATALICAVGLGIALATSYATAGWIIAALSGLGAIVVALQGFTETETTVLAAPPPPPNLLPELHRLRNLDWLARELCRRTQRAARFCHDNVAQLRAEAGTASQEDAKTFPFSREVCAALLERKQIWPADSLRQFWEDEAAFERAIGEEAANLLELLREHARRSCAAMAGLEWSDIFVVSSGPAASEGLFWREALETARAGSVPWVPVPGASVQTFLALPQSLTDEARSLLVERFPDQKSVEEIDGNQILVVQLSQGYREEVS